MMSCDDMILRNTDCEVSTVGPPPAIVRGGSGAANSAYVLCFQVKLESFAYLMLIAQQDLANQHEV